MEIDLKRLRACAERYANDDAHEDLDAEKWGEAMPPWEVLALLDALDAANGERARPGRPAEEYVCTACNATMRRYADYEEYQHADCGGLVRLRAEIERDAAEQRVAEQIAAWLQQKALILVREGNSHGASLVAVVEAIRRGDYKSSQPPKGGPHARRG